MEWGIHTFCVLTKQWDFSHKNVALIKERAPKEPKTSNKEARRSPKGTPYVQKGGPEGPHTSRNEANEAPGTTQNEILESREKTNSL